MATSVSAELIWQTLVLARGFGNKWLKQLASIGVYFSNYELAKSSPRQENLIPRIAQTRNDVPNVIQMAINRGGENLNIRMRGVKPCNAFGCGGQY